MRVLISRGGIAGLTLAYWLHQFAISCVVIDFLSTGYEIAKRMGLITNS